MCNLFTARKSAAEVARLFDARHIFAGDGDGDGDGDDGSDEDVGMDANVNADEEIDIYPGYDAPIIRMVDDARLLEQKPWGFVTFKPRARAPKEGQSARVFTRWTNARHLEKSMWRRSAADPAHHCPAFLLQAMPARTRRKDSCPPSPRSRAIFRRDLSHPIGLNANGRAWSANIGRGRPGALAVSRVQGVASMSGTTLNVPETVHAPNGALVNVTLVP